MRAVLQKGQRWPPLEKMERRLWPNGTMGKESFHTPFSAVLLAIDTQTYSIRLMMGRGKP